MMKKLQLMTTAILFLVTITIQAQFSGEGLYRITSYHSTDYVSHETPSRVASTNTILSQASMSTNTIFQFVENSAGVYNILTENGERILTRSSATNVFSRPNTEINRAKGDCLFTITNSSIYETYLDGTTGAPYASGQTYLMSNTADGDELKQLKDHTNANLRTSTSTIGSVVKWYLKFEASLGVNDYKQTTNGVYPVPSSDGIFNLKEKAAWSVHAITGALIAQGNGTKIDISNAPNGVYILRFKGVSKKIIF
tara:strand:+ start:9309 stop:10070 length:762 start_codon:yes stop_codon:yes gene_type:complete